MKAKKITLYLSLIIVGIIVITLGVTYAFFGGKITGNETESTLSLDGGKMTITIDGGANITADDFIPDSDTPWIVKEITLTGQNDTEIDVMPYNIKIVEDLNEFTTTKMKYTLEAVNVDNSGNISKNVTALTDIDSGVIIATGYFGDTNACDNGCVHKYILSVYFIDTNTDQSDDMGARYNARIEVEGLKPVLPTLTVKYPKGATVTCTNGIDTYTAPDTSGTAAFILNNVGIWTVSGTLDDQSKSEDITIEKLDENYEIALAIPIYLLRNGTWNEITGGASTALNSSNYWQIWTGGSGEAVNTTYTNKLMDLQGYSTITFNLVSSAGWGTASWGGSNRTVLLKSGANGGGSNLKSVNNPGTGTLNINISDITVPFTLALSLNTWTNDSSKYYQAEIGVNEILVK